MKEFKGKKKSETAGQGVDRPKIDMDWLYRNFKPNDKNGFMNFWMDWKDRTCPTCGKCFKLHICAIDRHEYHYSGAYPQCGCDRSRTSLQTVINPLIDAQKAREGFEKIKKGLDDEPEKPTKDTVPF